MHQGKKPCDGKSDCQLKHQQRNEPTIASMTQKTNHLVNRQDCQHDLKQGIRLKPALTWLVIVRFLFFLVFTLRFQDSCLDVHRLHTLLCSFSNVQQEI